MRPASGQSDQSGFNDIRIDLRGGVGAALSKGQPNYYPNDNDRRSQGSVPSRISRYSGKRKRM